MYSQNDSTLLGLNNIIFNEMIKLKLFDAFGQPFTIG